jgi:hypothetical protein
MDRGVLIRGEAARGESATRHVSRAFIVAGIMPTAGNSEPSLNSWKELHA